MPIFLISYDLNKVKDYPKLITKLREHDCQRALESLWFGEFNNTAQELLDYFKEFIDGDDGMLVAEISKGKLARKMTKHGTSDWLASHG